MGCGFAICADPNPLLGTGLIPIHIGNYMVCNYYRGQYNAKPYEEGDECTQCDADRGSSCTDGLCDGCMAPDFYDDPLNAVGPQNCDSNMKAQEESLALYCSNLGGGDGCSVEQSPPAIDPTTNEPTVKPTPSPITASSTKRPSVSPTQSTSTRNPTSSTTQSPPGSSPINNPVDNLTQSPSRRPSDVVSVDTIEPTESPTQSPSTKNPTDNPTLNPSTKDPSVSPSQGPSTMNPTKSTSDPTRNPTKVGGSEVTAQPTVSKVVVDTTGNPTAEMVTTEDPTVESEPVESMNVDTNNGSGLGLNVLGVLGCSSCADGEKTAADILAIILCVLAVVILIGLITRMYRGYTDAKRIQERRRGDLAEAHTETETCTTELMEIIRDTKPKGVTLRELGLNAVLRERYGHMFEEEEV